MLHLSNLDCFVPSPGHIAGRTELDMLTSKVQFFKAGIVRDLSDSQKWAS
jgi:hypothetical protein